MDISYRFRRAESEPTCFDLHLDDRRLESPAPDEASLPAWTELGFEQCTHCPLQTANCRHCPLAARLVQILERFGDGFSHETLQVEVEVAGRTIAQQTTAQRGISALLGLVVATSGCPHTVYLKPMARFHLPFASEEETIYRAVSMYLLARYFQRGESAVLEDELQGLTDIYRRLQVVNACMAKRLRAAAAEGDAAVNALVLLDLYAKALPAVVADRVDEVRYLFADYGALMNSGPA